MGSIASYEVCITRGEWGTWYAANITHEESSSQGNTTPVPPQLLLRTFVRF